MNGNSGIGPIPLEPFATRHVADVQPQPIEQRWLIEDLWLAQSVGVLAGHPKVGKTFLAAQIALAVAANSEVLGKPARLCGPVLFYGAEDSLSALRTRFDGLAAIAGIPLGQLPIYLLDIPILRIDRDADLMRLRAAIETHRPRLLVLDPFIRIAHVDENSSADVSAVLASLRAIQRDYDTAVLLVHHARKSPSAHPQLALRGSTDFAAWADSGLYLTRSSRHLQLWIEHRSAPTPEPISLRLRTDPAPHLHVTEPDAIAPQVDPIQSQLLRILEETARPISTLELREQLRRRKADVVGALEAMRNQGMVDRESKGWVRALNRSVPCSHPRDAEHGNSRHHLMGCDSQKA